MSDTYITRDGELLDSIAWKIYGTEQAVHLIVAANRHISSLPIRLPAGVLLRIPQAPTYPEPVATIRLWS
ncbi:MAG: tail protein X [Porticoccaceae bacterium]